MKALAMACAAALALAVPAGADIERRATVTCQNGQGTICFYIWPALPIPAGWHQDEDASFHYSVNILVPNGKKFRNAEAVLSGNVIPEDGYQTSHPGPSALDSFIADDLEHTRADNAGVEIAEQEPLATADGMKLRLFLFKKLCNGDSQLLAYTEDGDHDGKFFVMLMMDAASDQAFETNQHLFREMIGAYKHFKAN